jgi:hypothetical protein
LAPSAASFNAMAFPIPLLAPVIKTVLFLNDMAIYFRKDKDLFFSEETNKKANIFMLAK